jgi:GT2 family glycosyltransferase
MTLVEGRRRLSVCMASYNGSRYIREQIDSILSQIEPGDELIVVDDCSGDDTPAIVRGFKDGRVRLVQNERNCGPVRTFERALECATGDVIFLSDQDDVWADDKVGSILAVFAQQPEVSLVFTDTEVIDATGTRLGRSFLGETRSWGGLFTLISNRYLGCTMAFRRKVLDTVLPFPPDIPMHDSWIGLANILVGKSKFLDVQLVRYRRHSGNATGRKRLSLKAKVQHRWTLGKCLVSRALQ